MAETTINQDKTKDKSKDKAKNKIKKSVGDIKIYWPQTRSRAETNSSILVTDPRKKTQKTYNLKLKNGHGIIAVEEFNDMYEVRLLVDKLVQSKFEVNSEQAKAFFSPKSITGLWYCFHPDFTTDRAIEKKLPNETTTVEIEEKLKQTVRVENGIVKTSNFIIKNALEEQGYFILS